MLCLSSLHLNAVILLWLCCLCAVLANTEIVNLQATESELIAIQEASRWPVLSADAAEQLWNLIPAPLDTPLEEVCEVFDTGADVQSPNSCPHEVWILLDLESAPWRLYTKFTLRISWPASSPADFSIQTYSPSALEDKLRANASLRSQHPPKSASTKSASSTRLQYARIRIVDTGVRTPPSNNNTTQPVAFIIQLEPLYLGVLPASVYPILIFLLPVIAFAAIVILPLINEYIARLALQVRVETHPTGQLKRKRS